MDLSQGLDPSLLLCRAAIILTRELPIHFREQAVNEAPESKGKKELKPWTKPQLRKIPLTDNEVAQLRASDDPMALLLKIKPEL